MTSRLFSDTLNDDFNNYKVIWLGNERSEMFIVVCLDPSAKCSQTTVSTSWSSASSDEPTSGTGRGHCKTARNTGRVKVRDCNGIETSTWLFLVAKSNRWSLIMSDCSMAKIGWVNCKQSWSMNQGNENKNFGNRFEECFYRYTWLIVFLTASNRAGENGKWQSRTDEK